MDPDHPHTIPLVEGESRDDLKVSQQNFSSPSSNLESESPWPDSQTIELKLPTTKDGVTLAVPLSYCLPAKPNNSKPPKDKKGSPSEKKQSKKEAQFQQQFSARWECVPRPRRNGQLDKFYRHIETGVMCRSLPDIERYEKQGIIPRHSPKQVKTQNTKEIVKEMGDASETKEASAAKKLRETQEGKGVVDENFMEDAHIYQNKSCRDKDYSSDDSERTPSPPWSRTGIIPRFAPKV